MRTEPSKPGVHTEVGVRQLREELSTWLDRVKEGDRVTITDRGRPVARLVPVDVPSPLELLIAEGRVTPGRRPRPRIRLEDLVKPSGGTVSDYLKDESE